MATNKNALIRYKHLDILLSDRHHYYDINDLTERVNDMLLEEGFQAVTRRCIEKDLVYLTERPFCAPIERKKRNGKNCVYYKNASFSIFKQEMSREERNLLREVLNTIGQFGLGHKSSQADYQLQQQSLPEKLKSAGNTFRHDFQQGGCSAVVSHIFQ